jgi:hypothetical protein
MVTLISAPPPPPAELIVILGHVAVIVIPVPAVTGCVVFCENPCLNTIPIFSVDEFDAKCPLRRVEKAKGPVRPGLQMQMACENRTVRRQRMFLPAWMTYGPMAWNASNRFKLDY